LTAIPPQKNISDKDDDQTERTDGIITDLFCPSIEAALCEIEKRRRNPCLVRKVEKYLQNDIPEHFLGSSPVLYLSRHLATPSYEVAHVIEITKNYNYDLVIGEDIKSKFVANNELKISLGKLPIVKGLSRNGNEIFENVTIIDFATSQGKPMNEINTTSGKTLREFHRELFKSIYPESPEIFDESDWIDRHARNDIAEQYKKMLALLCVHGVMLESYVSDELTFVTEVVSPAFKAIEKEIGVRPLIIEHITPEQEVTKNWNSYPSYVYEAIKK
jgi:hypothetical protein